MAVLVCGGAGYIGSHTVRELLAAGEVNRYASSVRTAVDCAARSAFSLSARIGSTVMNVISATANTAIRAADIFMLLDTAVHLYLPSNS